MNGGGASGHASNRLTAAAHADAVGGQGEPQWRLMRGADADSQLLVRGRGAAACVVVAVVAVAVMLVAWFAQATCSAPRAQPLQGRKRERGDDAVSSGGRAAAGRR